MRASEYAKQAKLGDIITTMAMGSYPGGKAEVIEIYPDPNAPDIVLNVKHPNVGTMGIFEYEDVEPPTR